MEKTKRINKKRAKSSAIPTLIKGETTVDSHIQKFNMLGESSFNIDKYRFILSASENPLLCDFSCSDFFCSFF